MFYPDSPCRIKQQREQNPSPCQTYILVYLLRVHALLMCRKKRTPPRPELCRRRGIFTILWRAVSRGSSAELATCWRPIKRTTANERFVGCLLLADRCHSRCSLSAEGSASAAARCRLNDDDALQAGGLRGVAFRRTLSGSVRVRGHRVPNLRESRGARGQSGPWRARRRTCP